MRGLKSQNRTLQKMHDKIVIMVARIVVLITVILLIWCQNNYIVTRNYVYSAGDVPKSFVGYKILHISDICNTSHNLIHAANKAKPDIILLSGGYQDVTGNYSTTVSTVNKLCEIAPVYYIYNTNDTADCLADTQAVNITDNSIDVNSGISEANTLIQKAYGSEIINRANNGDEDATEYIKYVADALSNEKYSTIKICGINNMNNSSYKEIQSKEYELTGTDEDSMVVMLNGNLANLDSLCANNIDIMFVGGTFGKSSDIASCSKGDYSYLGTELFVSGGCGNNGKKRIANMPEIQLITLSDGTIKQTSPLEKLLDKLITNVGTIYDNDGGFKEYEYKYGLGS